MPVAIHHSAGEVFGRLTILGPAPRLGRDRAWLCRCSCGAEKPVRGVSLRNGDIVSCGCHSAELARKRQYRHGLCDDPIYNSFCSIKSRCTNPNNQDWDLYGGRGIRCDFRSAQELFCVLGPRPSPEHSVDRYPNQNGHYQPGNVRWATQEQQNRNRRSNRLIEYQGRIMCIADWADATGLNANMIRRRLNRGWSVKDALTKPSRPTRPF